MAVAASLLENSGVLSEKTSPGTPASDPHDPSSMAVDTPDEPHATVGASQHDEPHVVEEGASRPDSNLDPSSHDPWTDDNDDDDIDAEIPNDDDLRAGQHSDDLDDVNDDTIEFEDLLNAEGSDVADPDVEEPDADAKSKKILDDIPTGKVFEDREDNYDLAYDVSRDLRQIGNGGMSKTRRRDAYRRLVQSTSYAILLEERVKELETSLEAVEGRLAGRKDIPDRRDVPPIRPPSPRRRYPDDRYGYSDRYPEVRRERDYDRDYIRRRRSSIEEIVVVEPDDEVKAPEMILTPVRLSLDEFESHVDLPEDKANHFLEFLVEKPSPGRPSNAMHLSRSRRRRRKTHRSGKVIDKNTKNKVERIRINSEVLCEVLEDVLGKDVAPTTGAVVLRPFKPILGYLSELREYAVKLQKEIDQEGVPDVETNEAKLSDAKATKEEATTNDDVIGPADSTATAENVGDAKQTMTPLDKTAETISGKDDSVLASDVADTEKPSDSVELPTVGGETAQDSHSEQVADNDERRASGSKTVEFEPAEKKTPNTKKLAHLQALLNCFEGDLKEILDLHISCRQRTKSTAEFDELWHFFQPGDIIWAPKGTQAYQVLSVHDGRQILNPTYDDSGSDRRGREDDLLADIDDVVKNPFIIDAFHVDFDGEVFGPVQYHWTIKPWAGEKMISKLDTYPLAFAEPKPFRIGSLVNTESMASAEAMMREMLLERGRKFKKYANAEKVEAVDYKGMTAADLPEQIDSQVIIDTSYYYDTNKKDIPDIGLLDPTEGDRREIMERCACGRELCEMKSCYDDRKVEQDRMDTFITESAGSLRTTAESGQDFKDEYLILLPGQMWGFVLHNRAWHLLDVSKLEPARKTQAFEDLVLKPEHRKLVESQVTMHSTGVKPAAGSVGQAEIADDKREDLVRGKGKGLIILLHGAPGVGKTSTAECVAEYTKRPLLSITCGDIGDEAMDVQKNLEFNLNLAHRWGCVMLLDEADVFLATRDKRDMKRNAVVSVFLRVLEYYSGILFLTTNKIGVIDEAFQSRIHLSLYYPPLDEEQTAKIWEINLRRQKKNKPHLEFEERDLLRWAQYHWDRCNRQRTAPWNGRQIRNACQTVAALAEFDNKGKITVDHLKAVAKASSEFDDYLKSVHGGDNAFRAKRVQDRRDDYYDLNRSARDEDDEDEYWRSGYAYVDEHDEAGDPYRDPPPSARLPRRNTAGSRRSARNEHYSPLYDDDYDAPRASRAELGDRDRDRDRRGPPPPDYDEPLPRERPGVKMGPPPRPSPRDSRDAPLRDRGPVEGWSSDRRPSRARSSRERTSDVDRRR